MNPLDIVQVSPVWATLAIGSPGPAFESLPGTDGHRYGFSTLVDRDILVLIFSSNRCPTAKAYGERMNALQREYGPQGVQLVAINSNNPHLYPDESFPRMVERAAEDAYTFPYVVDADQRVAMDYGAACTFHVFVLDRDRHLRYQGRFDSSRIAAKVTSHDLNNALEDILARRDVLVTTTHPFGCSLDFV